jgi:hypothetical protein
MDFDFRKWFGFLEGERRYFGRDLTDQEIETCRHIYFGSQIGWTRTKQLMRKALRSAAQPIGEDRIGGPEVQAHDQLRAEPVETPDE